MRAQLLGYQPGPFDRLDHERDATGVHVPRLGHRTGEAAEAAAHQAPGLELALELLLVELAGAHLEEHLTIPHNTTTLSAAITYRNAPETPVPLRPVKTVASAA